MPPKKKDVAAQKAARDKKILAGLSVVFVAIFVLMVLPKLTAKSPAAQAATADPTATTPVVPTPGTTTPEVPTDLSGVGVSSGSYSSPGYSFTAADGQLKGLNGHLKSKDPFAGAPAVTTEAVTPPPKLTDDLATSGSGTGGGTSSPGKVTPGADPYIYASLTVNGITESVALNAPFPAASPLFVLRSITGSGITFSLGLGTFVNGAKTVSLAKGHKLTLTNTADHSRYVIELVSVSRVAPQTSTVPVETSTGVLVTPGTGTTPAVTETPPPPTPETSTTTTTTG